MKIASRYLLPLELFLAVTMIAWGLSGWLGGGGLWFALHATNQNLEWGSVMVAIGASHFIAAGSEWVFGKHWCARKLMLAVSNRAVCSALATIVWFYAGYKIVTLEGMDQVVSLWIQAPIAALFSAWCFVGNLKVRHVLDPDIPTVLLENTIIMERRRVPRG